MFNGSLNGVPLYAAFAAAQAIAERTEPGSPPSIFAAEVAKCNSITLTLGPDPSRAWVLVERSNLNALYLNGTFTLTLVYDLPVAGTASFGGLVVTKEPSVVLASNVLGDPAGVCLVELADQRWLCRNPTYAAYVNAQYNVRSQPYQGASDQTIYDAGSLDEAAVWTWATMAQDLWERCQYLGSWPGLPWTPGGTPEGWIFQGVSAYDALNQVLTRIGCALCPRVNSSALTIVQIGASDNATLATINAAIANNQRVSDAEFTPITAGIVPYGVAVCFHRQEQYGGTEETTAQTGEAWAAANVVVVQIAGGISGAVPGVYTPIWDDLPALFAPPSTAIAASSNGATLPQSTINVLSTTDFPSSGTITVFVDGLANSITYTGTTTASFTGCTGGAGTLRTGQSVNVIANSSALLTRAQERAGDFFRMLVAGGQRLWQRFTGLVPVFPGSLLKGVSFRQNGDGAVTEIWRHPMLGRVDERGQMVFEDATKLHAPALRPRLPNYPPMPQVLALNGSGTVTPTSGYYDCLIQKRDAANTLWLSKEAIWGLELNGAAQLQAPGLYLCRLTGYYAGRPVYAFNANYGVTAAQARCFSTCTNPLTGAALPNQQTWCATDTLVGGVVMQQGTPALSQDFPCLPCSCGSGSGSGNTACCQGSSPPSGYSTTINGISGWVRDNVFAYGGPCWATCSAFNQLWELPYTPRYSGGIYYCGYIATCTIKSPDTATFQFSVALFPAFDATTLDDYAFLGVVQNQWICQLEVNEGFTGETDGTSFAWYLGPVAEGFGLPVNCGSSITLTLVSTKNQGDACCANFPASITFNPLYGTINGNSQCSNIATDCGTTAKPCGSGSGSGSGSGGGGDTVLTNCCPGGTSQVVPLTFTGALFGLGTLNLAWDGSQYYEWTIPPDTAAFCGVTELLLSCIAVGLTYQWGLKIYAGQTLISTVSFAASCSSLSASNQTIALGTCSGETFGVSGTL